MKGYMPIVIASILIVTLFIASLYYIIAFNIRGSVDVARLNVFNWALVDEQLDTLVYLMLSESSRHANSVYNSTGSLQDAMSTMQLNCTNILNNWTSMKNVEGFTIVVNNITCLYKVGDRTGSSSIFLNTTIYAPSGEYRVFTKTSSLSINASAEHTIIDLPVSLDGPSRETREFLERLYQENITLDTTFSVDLTVLYTVNNNRYYYIVDHSYAEALINEYFLRLRARWARYYDLLANYTYLKDVSVFYAGEGVNTVVATITIDIPRIWGLIRNSASAQVHFIIALRNMYRSMEEPILPDISVFVENIVARARL